MEHRGTVSKDIEFKQKRERVIRNEYPSGILGVDNPIDPTSKIYYDKNQNLQQKEEKLRQHLMNRQKNIVARGGVSEQINFANTEFTKRSDKVHHEISPFWSRKKRVAQ